VEFQTDFPTKPLLLPLPSPMLQRKEIRREEKETSRQLSDPVLNKFKEKSKKNTNSNNPQ
jgi:hypothetical protein